MKLSWTRCITPTRFQYALPAFSGRKARAHRRPPVIASEIETLRPAHSLAHAAAQSRLLAGKAREVAEEKGAWYIDASRIVYPPLDDCLHLSPEGHRKLGECMAAKIKEILG